MEIRDLLQQFQNIMSASFIEEGRFETVKRMLHERHKVLLVLTGMEADMDAVRYALNLSRRIGAGIRILYLARDYSEIPFLENSLKELKALGIGYQIKPCEGSIKEETIRFIDTEKDADISFVVMDSRDLGIRSLKNQKTDLQDWERLKCPLVLVSKTSNFLRRRRLIMAQEYGNLKKKPVGRMIVYGALSAALYAALLLNQSTITALFTRGSWYAALPIATAFAISFIHGGFTSYFWSVLGVEATKKALRTRTEEKKPVYDRERPQPQPRLRARL
jgi:hypothetical protein